MMPPVNAPSFDAKGKPFPNYARAVEFWNRAPSQGPPWRASAQILKMGPVRPEVCVAVGTDQIVGPDGVPKTSQVLHDYIATAALDPIKQQLGRFL